MISRHFHNISPTFAKFSGISPTAVKIPNIPMFSRQHYQTSWQSSSRQLFQKTYLLIQRRTPSNQQPHAMQRKRPQSQWRRMNLRLQWACQTWGHQGSTSQRLCCGHCGSRSPGPWQHNTANLAHSRKQKINLMPKLLISFDISFRLYAICINYQLCLWHRWHQNRSGSANDKHTTKFLLTIQ